MSLKGLMDKGAAGSRKIRPEDAVARLLDEKRVVERRALAFAERFNQSVNCPYLTMLFRYGARNRHQSDIPALTWRMKRQFSIRVGQTVKTQMRGYLDLFDRHDAAATEARRLIQLEAPGMYELLIQWEHLRVMLVTDCYRAAGEYRAALKLNDVYESRCPDVVANRSGLKRAKEMARSEYAERPENTEDGFVFENLVV